MNVLEIELYTNKAEYEESLVDYKKLSEEEIHRFIDNLDEWDEHDRIRDKISKCRDNGWAYISQPYRFITDITIEEFKIINDDSCGDSYCKKRGECDLRCQSYSQWDEYWFDKEIADELDDSCFFSRIWWHLYENKENKSYPEMPRWLKEKLLERLDRRSC